MFDRKAIKKQAKVTLKACYWTTILVIGVLMILGVISSCVPNKDDVEAKVAASEFTASLSGVDAETLTGLAILFGAVAAIAGIVCLLVFIFFECPLIAGSARYFLKADQGECEPGHILSFFKKGVYRNATKTVFKKYFRIFLWSLLCLVPGIIKAYQYRMVEYILSENPDMPAKDVLEASRDMMAGNKWSSFVFDLSFIGWDILSVFTFGILQFFFVRPYKMHADAGLYLAIKNQDKAQA